MIRDLTELAAVVAVGGALALGGCVEENDVEDTDVEAGCPADGCPATGCPSDGCPSDGCPSDGCPSDGCPSDGCPTGQSGFDPNFETSPDFFTQMMGPVDGGAVHGTVQIWYSTDLMSSIGSACCSGRAWQVRARGRISL